MAQTTTVRIGSSNNEGSGQAFFGVDQGFLARAGIEAEIVMLANGPAIAAAIAGGSVDVGASSSYVFMNAWRHNLPYLIVAPGALYRSDDATSALVVASNSTVRSARDLNGQTVAGISVGALDQASIMAWIDQNGGESRSIKVVESPPSAMVDGLEIGRFAAALLLEPQLSAAGNRIRIIGKAYDAVAKTFMLSVWFATSDWAGKNAGLVRRLNDAFGQAGTWSARNPETAAVSVEKWTKIKVPRVRTHYAPRLDAALLQPVCDVALRYKFIDAPIDARNFLFAERG